jgi:hypothetical protein
MGANPLLLALLIGVFLLGRQQLPELRTQLYEKGVQLLLRRVEVRRSPRPLLATDLTEIYTCDVCSCQYILRRNGCGQAGETGRRDPKATAAVLKDRPRRTAQRAARRRRRQPPPPVDAIVKDPARLMEILSRMGHWLHVEERTRDFDAGQIFDLLEDERTDLGSLSVDDACDVWEDLLEDGRGILMCVQQNPDGDGDPDKDVFRSTHLTFQEYFAARQCCANARASGDLLRSLVDGEQAVFGMHPSPWLREVLLMTSELLTAEEFEQLASWYLDCGDQSGAAAVRVTTMLRCRREDTTAGVGLRIQQRLAQTRDAQTMVLAASHPSDDLRTQALTEIVEYRMPRAPVVEGMLQLLREPADASRPWYDLQTGSVC